MDDARTTRRLGAAIVAALGLVQCWRYRHFMYPDGVQYLDVAREVAAGDPGAFVNLTWSPLYPGLIALVLGAGDPGAYWWYPAVQLVNAAIFLVAVWAFDRLLVAVIRLRGEPAALLTPARLAAAGYALFALLLTYVLNVRLMTPDLIVAIVWLEATRLALLATAGGPAPRLVGARLGVVLGVGYYAKAIVFPSALVFLGVLAVAARARWRRAVALPLTAGLAFVVTSAPLVVALSGEAGRPTFGGVGPMVYAWHVNEWSGGPLWTGDPPGSGIPEHPVARLAGELPVFGYRFDRPVTYPPFYDPAYWTAGMRARFDVADQLRAFRRVAGELRGALGLTVGPVALLIAAAAVGAGPRAWWRRWRPAAGVAAAALATTALYLPVHVEGRFIAAQVLVVLLTGLAALPPWPGRWPGRAATLAVVAWALVFVGPVAGGAVKHAALDLAQGEARAPSLAWRNAEALARAGVRAGDAVAIVDNRVDVTWAQLAELRLVAEVPASAVRWAERPEAERRRMLEGLRRAGARWILIREAAEDGEWVRVLERGPW